MISCNFCARIAWVWWQNHVRVHGLDIDVWLCVYFLIINIHTNLDEKIFISYYIYIHRYTHVYIYIHTYIHIHAYKHALTHTYIHTHPYIHTHIHIHMSPDDICLYIWHSGDNLKKSINKRRNHSSTPMHCHYSKVHARHLTTAQISRRHHQDY